jgi:hypothetical protein
MSTEPYPEVSGDESGIVPKENARPPEWPKKLRTLTAAELDRLTIDNSGRFYWDGKLVDYGGESKQITDKTSDSLNRSMDILDRASVELADRKSPTTIEGQLAEPAGSSAEPSVVALDAHRAPTLPPPVIRGAEHTQVTLSTWQTVGAVIAVLAIAIGALGMATYGYVAARDWGCRTGAFHDGCPAAPEKAPQRTDIPA